MNDIGKVTHDIKKTRREQLIEQCIKIGMPVAGDENEETLEMYLDVADDDFDESGIGIDGFSDEKTANESSKDKMTNILGKFAALFM